MSTLLTESSSPSSSARAILKRKAARPKTTRAPSSSQIARAVPSFEIWSAAQQLVQASYSDVPAELSDDTAKVFEFTGKLPISWTLKPCHWDSKLSTIATPEFISFVKQAHTQSPELFMEWEGVDHIALHAQLSIVFLCWNRLIEFNNSGEKWSEADYAANVYTFRSMAVQTSALRVQCSVSLPQPNITNKTCPQTMKILQAKTATPDCMIMIPSLSIRHLCQSAQSPYKVLASKLKSRGSAAKSSSFRFQSTLCSKLPDNPGFEFCSSIWEDKKPVDGLDDAYRQNRMSSASAVRHLHSLGIEAPVFGLVWASGTVRAHVDWYQSSTVYSAPYSVNHETFRDWKLERPSDILQVYFLIRNLDRWTVGGFMDRVTEGLVKLIADVRKDPKVYHPWRRHSGDLVPQAPRARKENVNASYTSEGTPVKVDAKSKGRKAKA